MRPNIDAIMMRSRLTGLIESYLRKQGYVNVPTPIICNDLWDKSEALTVMCSEKQVGYLATSPQAYKLELISSGIPRYFQIAPCFRMEEAHDRKLNGLHYQIDIETANTDASEFRGFIEVLLSTTLNELGLASFRTFNDIPIITFEEAVHLYGTDKPDLRNGVRLIRNHRPATATTSDRNLAIAVPCTKFSNSDSRGLISHLEAEKKVTLMEISGFYTVSRNNEVAPTSESDFNEEIFKLFVFEPSTEHEFAASHIVNSAGHYLDLIDTETDIPVWITEFPLFTQAMDGGLRPYHDLFTSPTEGEVSIGTSTKAKQFDLVCNGIEIASCATRIHDFKELVSVFEACGLQKLSLKKAHPSLFDVYQTGVTPSTGCGIGVERLLMIVSRTTNIHEVLPFSRK